jgi:predicted Rossmann fold flavoprotein
MKQIIIIWGGAAGMMAAATILEHAENTDFHIHLFEKNMALGKKVLISWGGRCNVTTGIEDKKLLLSKYTRWADFIKKALGKFSPKKCREWFESHGVPIKIEEDMRVFPVSDDGGDVVDAFENIFAKYRDNITIHLWEWITDVSFDSDTVRRYIITTQRWTYTAETLIITTGGNAYSHTGSTGDGYNFARALGHTITQLWPSLSSFLIEESWIHTCSGLVLESAELRYHDQRVAGSLLLTHFWISGPLAFMMSSKLAWEDIGKWHTITLDLIPIQSMGRDQWENWLKENFALHPKKFISSLLSEKLPRRFVEAFVNTYCSWITEKFVGTLSRNDRESLSTLLGNGIPLTITDRRPGDEFVTAGGVSTDEIDGETMESKIQKNLYFAGEILNVDWYTGGYSLQICWASGYVAGRNIASKFL